MRAGNARDLLVLYQTDLRATGPLSGQKIRRFEAYMRLRGRFSVEAFRESIIFLSELGLIKQDQVEEEPSIHITAAGKEWLKLNIMRHGGEQLPSTDDLTWVMLPPEVCLQVLNNELDGKSE